LLVVGVGLIGTGIYVLLKRPYLPGGKLNFRGIQVDSAGAGLPLVMLGVVALLVTNVAGSDPPTNAASKQSATATVTTTVTSTPTPRGKPESATPTATPTHTHTVTYKVDGSNDLANVSYSTTSGSEQWDDVAVPWQKTFKKVTGGSPWITAQNPSSQGEGTVTCEIHIDGVQVETATSSGPGSVARCKGELMPAERAAARGSWRAEASGPSGWPGL
jgi:hypothetical protein